MSSMKEQIAARRAAAKATTSASRTTAAQASANAAASRGYGQSAPSAPDTLEDRTAIGQIKRAAKSGKLDLSSLNLPRIPAETYTLLLGIPTKELSNPPDAEAAGPSGVQGMTATFSAQLALAEKAERDAVFNKAKKEEAWVEPEAELVQFSVEGNSVEVVEREIGAFGGLKSVNLSSNRISSLPDSFADLLRLTTLNLSHNALAAVPPAILLLPKLEVLDLSHNALLSLDLSSPLEPTDEGLSYGAGFLSTSFSRQTKASKVVWPMLRSLNLGHNRLSAEGLRGLRIPGGFKSLRLVNLESNALEGELDVEAAGLGREAMPGLTSLVLSGNGYLRAVKGELAEGCKVDKEGTGTFTGSRPAAPASSSADTSTTRDTPSGPAPDVPQPDLRLVYRTLPAATFDSLPLEVDLDLYLPPTPSSSGKGHPVVVWFHGGGLLQGNKENLPPHFRRLPQTPYDNGENVAVISPNYRLAPQVPIIDILSDVTALVTFIQTKLNERIAKAGKGEKRIDAERICLSGGSAGGYLAMIGGMEMPLGLSDEDVGGYRGEKGVKCVAPFYPITDLTDKFWATETNPVPWMDRSISQAEAKPHLDLRAPPICTAISGGPRSILYPYMLQHALFPSLLFMNQRSIGSGLDGFRPSPAALSMTTRLDLLAKGVSRRRGEKEILPIPVYFAYGGKDDKVQPMEKTVAALKEYKGQVTYEYRPEGDHQFDEDPREACEAFRKWLGETLL